MLCSSRPSPCPFCERIQCDRHDNSSVRIIARPGSGGPPCTSAGLGPTSFGPSSSISQYMLAWNKNCILIGNVNITAGVTNSTTATYITSRVIEDQTPISSVVFDPSPWVQEVLWLMPDLMTMVAVVNSTLLPTYDNIDGYVEVLIRQSYLAAWNMFHAWFDTDGPLVKVATQEARIRASVSFARVFSWLGISLLSTAGGIIVLGMAAGYAEDDEERNEVHDEVMAQLAGAAG